MKTVGVWTQEDEDRAEADRKNWQVEKIGRIRKDAQKKYDTNFENYQVTGSPSQERAYRHWEDVLDICRMAEASLSQSCARCELRHRNGRALGKQLEERKKLGEKTISIDEAIGLVYDIASW